MKSQKEVKAIQKKYFNQAMPQEYEKFLNPIKNLPEQTIANDLKELGSEANILQYFKDSIHNKYVGKSMAKGTQTAKEAEMLFLSLRYKDFDIPDEAFDLNSAKGKVAFGKFKTSLKKGELTDKLAFHLYNENTHKNRKSIERLLNIKPLAEFGENYAEHYHSGESAIAKLLNEKQGQVSGAFYRKELGDIDLVWGDSNFGLKHILDKHGSEFKDIAKELDEIIQNGEVVKRVGRDEAYNIEYKGFKVGINKGFNKQGENKWIVTAFDDNVEKTAKTAPANDSTKGASLPLNSNNIIPQKTQKSLFDTPS